MHLPDAVDALSALAHPHRLAAFRLLVRATPTPLAAGAIAQALDVRPSTLSTHLALLERAGLIGSTRDGRSILYAVDQAGTRGLLTFLVADCCAGKPELCGPLGAAAEGCKSS